jgi:hypothetical protein
VIATAYMAGFYFLYLLIYVVYRVVFFGWFAMSPAKLGVAITASMTFAHVVFFFFLYVLIN